MRITYFSHNLRPLSTILCFCSQLIEYIAFRIDSLEFLVHKGYNEYNKSIVQRFGSATNISTWDVWKWVKAVYTITLAILRRSPVLHWWKRWFKTLTREDLQHYWKLALYSDVGVWEETNFFRAEVSNFKWSYSKPDISRKRSSANSSE